MKKLDNFKNCFNVLKNSDKEEAYENEIYRMGVVGQFNLCFELAWKTLQEVLALHSVNGSKTGSPREILKLGFKVSFIDDESVWLDMLSKRNTVVHVYDEEEASILLEKIYGEYMNVFENFAEKMKEKISEM